MLCFDCTLSHFRPFLFLRVWTANQICFQFSARFFFCLYVSWPFSVATECQQVVNKKQWARKKSRFFWVVNVTSDKKRALGMEQKNFTAFFNHIFLLLGANLMAIVVLHFLSASNDAFHLLFAFHAKPVRRKLPATTVQLDERSHENGKVLKRKI